MTIRILTAILGQEGITSARTLGKLSNELTEDFLQNFKNKLTLFIQMHSCCQYHPS